MWRTVGLRSFFAYCLALLAGSPAIGSPLVNSFETLKLLSLGCQNLQTRWLALSAGLLQLSSERKVAGGRLKRLLQTRVLVSVLFPLMLAACYGIRPTPPSPVPETPKPVFKCIDKALRLCPGVVAIETNDCGDAVKIASAALSALEQCQSYHSELVMCILDYLQQGSKNPGK